MDNTEMVALDLPEEIKIEDIERRLNADEQDIIELSQRLDIHAAKLAEVRTMARVAIEREKELRMFLKLQTVITILIMLNSMVFALAVGWGGGNGFYVWTGFVVYVALAVAEMMLVSRIDRRDR